jgi:RNA polymerase sigma-70 factor (ECF subfamily)
LKQEFLEEHGRSYEDLYRYAYRMLGNRESAEDIVQESFLRLYRTKPSLRREEERRWLYVVARNLCFTLMGRESRNPETSLDAESALESGNPGPRRHAEENERLRTIEKTVRRLPIALRETLLLREFEGMTYEEIAKFQDCPVGTVRSRLAAARKRLQEELRPLLEEVP